MTCECGQPTLPGSHLCFGCRDAVLTGLKCRQNMGLHNACARHHERRGSYVPNDKPPKNTSVAQPPSVRYAANLDRMKGKR